MNYNLSRLAPGSYVLMLEGIIVGSVVEITLLNHDTFAAIDQEPCLAALELEGVV